MTTRLLIPTVKGGETEAREGRSRPRGSQGGAGALSPHPRPRPGTAWPTSVGALCAQAQVGLPAFLSRPQQLSAGSGPAVKTLPNGPQVFPSDSYLSSLPSACTNQLLGAPAWAAS